MGIEWRRRCVDHSRREAEAAAEQVCRLTDVIGEHDRLQAQLRQLYERDQAVRSEWIAGGRNGPDPGAAADTARLNDRIVAMHDELAAAKGTLPAKEAVHRAMISRVQAAQVKASALLPSPRSRSRSVTLQQVRSPSTGGRVRDRLACSSCAASPGRRS
jgi:hypothetical protein